MTFHIVTPTLNQSEFLPWTINSIQNQGGGMVNSHFIVDGGSRDGTLDYLTKIKGNKITWVSVTGMTQSQALVYGFSEFSSEFLAYLNSDDIYLQNILNRISAIFDANPEIDFVYSNRIIVNQKNQFLGMRHLPKHTRFALWYAEMIPQETLFWRKEAMEKVGSFSSSLDFAMDFDFLVRLIKNCRGLHINDFMTAFRVHPKSKTSTVYNEVGVSEVAKIKAEYELPNFKFLVLILTKLQLVYGKLVFLFLGKRKRASVQDIIFRSIEGWGNHA